VVCAPTAAYRSQASTPRSGTRLRSARSEQSWRRLSGFASLARLAPATPGVTDRYASTGCLHLSSLQPECRQRGTRRVHRLRGARLSASQPCWPNMPVSRYCVSTMPAHVPAYGALRTLVMKGSPVRVRASALARGPRAKSSEEVVRAAAHEAGAPSDAACDEGVVVALGASAATRVSGRGSPSAGRRRRHERRPAGSSVRYRWWESPERMSARSRVMVLPTCPASC